MKLIDCLNYLPVLTYGPRSPNRLRHKSPTKQELDDTPQLYNLTIFNHSMVRVVMFYCHDNISCGNLC